MNESQWAETQLQLKKLETLLPSMPGLESEQKTSLYGSLSDEQKLAGWRRWMAVMIHRGWKVGEEGNLTKGGIGAERIDRPANGFIGPWRASWDPKYNPRVDATAAILGATFISPNRYRYGMQLLDANGCQRDEENECPVCGSTPKDSYRVVRVEHPNPYVAEKEPHRQAFAACPRCSR